MKIKTVAGALLYSPKHGSKHVPKHRARSGRAMTLGSMVLASMLFATGAVAFRLYDGGSGEHVVAAGKTSGNVVSDVFDPAFVEVSSGSIVTWKWAAGCHNVGQDSSTQQALDPRFASDGFLAGRCEAVAGSFSHSFAASGIFNYYCSVHADQASADVADYSSQPALSMVGRISVVEFVRSTSLPPSTLPPPTSPWRNAAEPQPESQTDGSRSQSSPFPPRPSASETRAFPLEGPESSAPVASGSRPGTTVESVDKTPFARASGATDHLVDCTITGTESDDFLVGGPGSDVICGLGGDDVLIGQGGDDILRGGPGDDVLRGGNGADTLQGGPGMDFLKGNQGGDGLQGGSGRDVLKGGPGDDVLRGGGSNDSCDAGSGRRDVKQSC